MAKDSGGDALKILLGLGVGLGALALLSGVEKPETAQGELLTEGEGEGNTLGALGGETYTPDTSNWFDAGSNVKIFIPWEKKSVNRGGGRYETVFLWNGRWLTAQQLFKVWNPIRKLPAWMR